MVASSQYILGIRPGYDGLMVDPCIPAEWEGFRAMRRFRGAEYRIEVRNPDHVSSGVKKITLNGTVVDRVPVQPAGSRCEVVVELG